MIKFNLADSIDILERTPLILEEFLRDLPSKWIRNNEGGSSWSPFDVVGHLVHGEKTDWVPRMHIILSNNEKKDFESFDRFAQFDNNQGKSLNELLNEFRDLRKMNIIKLRKANIQAIDLKKTGIHPQFGTVTLRQLLASWVVHDLTHINQISRVLAKQYASEVGPWKRFMGVLRRR
jgi:hypothetical protein